MIDISVAFWDLT